MFRFAAPFILLLWFCAPMWALDIPKLEGRVNDRAGILSTEQAAALEEKLRQLEETDSTQVAVLIVPDLEGESLEDYTIRVVEAWKLGQKGSDNGALLFVSMKDRAVRIEVGYGLEPTLTDARSRQILQNEIIPRFRSQDFYGGIDAGVTGIIQTIQGVYQASPASHRRSGDERSGGILSFLIVLLFPLLWVISITGKWGGGVLGAGAGMLLPYTLVSQSLPLALAGGAVGAVAGVILGSLIQAAAKSGGGGRGPGGPYPGGGFGGGGFGSGGFGGGGFGGGGFSGGGGGFGGGGSSGSW